MSTGPIPHERTNWQTESIHPPDESSIWARRASLTIKQKYDFQTLFQQLLENEKRLPVSTKLNWVRANDDRLMDWIQIKVRPAVLAGFELETCYQQLKRAVERLPRNKDIPRQREPKVPGFQRTVKPEAGVAISSPSLALEALPKPIPPKGVVEEAVNKFIVGHEVPRFSFHSKQRFSDMKELISGHSGKALTEAVIRMPEKESEETYIPPEPAFAGIPLRAFEGEAFIFQKLADRTDSAQVKKPDFYTKFYIPDLQTMKKAIAKHQSSETGDPYMPISDHKFRDEDKPGDYGKPDFKLRISCPPQPQLLLYSTAESDVMLKARKKEDIQKREEEERLQRTLIAGQTRNEWGISKHIAPRDLQFTTLQPHPLLDKELYIDPFYVMARSYNF